MNDRLDACLAFTLRSDIEGGWSNDPRDPGGATMRGVTLATFRAWRHDPTATTAQLHGITDAELRAIYGAWYWQPPRCQDLPVGVDLMVFDMAVTSGVRRSAMLLQTALGVTADGWVGAATLATAAKAGPGLVARLGEAQGAFYRGLANFPTFGNGWLVRLGKREAAAFGVARPAVQAAPSATDALNDASLAKARGGS